MHFGDIEVRFLDAACSAWTAVPCSASSLRCSGKRSLPRRQKPHPHAREFLACASARKKHHRGNGKRHKVGFEIARDLCRSGRRSPHRFARPQRCRSQRNRSAHQYASSLRSLWRQHPHRGQSARACVPRCDVHRAEWRTRTCQATHRARPLELLFRASPATTQTFKP